MNILEISHLSKSFGSKHVLSDVSFTVPEHCVFGFIGRNGAGKTTTMKAILGMLPVDHGEIRICGENVKCGNTPTNRYVGYLPDVPAFYDCMTAPEYLHLCCEITGIPRAEQKSRCAEMLELVGLADEKHRIKGFSRGMKQWLGIAQALIHRPKLLICDEPTSALDPVGRKEILDILGTATSQTSVVFSTHILSDVERICTDLAVLEGGKIALSGTIEEVRRLRRGTSLELVPAEGSPQTLSELFPDAKIDGEKLVFTNVSQQIQEQIMQTLLTHHIPIARMEQQEADLEQLFMEVIGK